MLESAEDQTEAAVAEHVPALGMTCRFCRATADHVFVDLGMSPLCESFLGAEQLNQMEAVLSRCGSTCVPAASWFNCLNTSARRTSSASTRTFPRIRRAGSNTRARTRRMIRRRLNLTEQSLVVELASNDGYLLQHFVAAGIPLLGIEPADQRRRGRAEEDTCRPAPVSSGPTRHGNWSPEGERADLLVGNNVLAHVPDLNDFVAGMKIAAQAARA